MTGLGYTLPAVIAVIAVCALEFGILHTGLFRRPAYWISMVIVFAFMIPVDGWLTKLSAPIVIYDDSHTTGIRFPFDIPVEDFLFGFALVTAVLLLWERQRLRDRKDRERAVTERKSAVPAAFDAGAPAYDGLVDANPGYHRHLRMSADRMRLAAGGKGLRLLDAGCGTGASTVALLSVAPQAEIVAVDASSGMLAEAAAKRWPSTVRFVHSRIEDLAAAGVDGPFDGIFAAYLLRNLEDPDAQLTRVPNAFETGGDARGARVLGARLAHRDSHVERGVRDDHHPDGQAAQR